MVSLSDLKERARRLKADTLVLYFAARDPRTPWYARLLVASIIAYVLSPIDLIPDFVPVLGYLDDLILVPIGIAFAIKLIPNVVLVDCRARVQTSMQAPVSRIAGAAVVAVWLSVMVFCIVWTYESGLGPSLITRLS